MYFQGFIGSGVFDQDPLRIEFSLNLGYAQHIVHRRLRPKAIVEQATFRAQRNVTS